MRKHPSIKKLLTFIFCLLILFLYTQQSYSATTTPVPTKSTPTDEESLKQMEKIKDLVASRVAELKLVDKRGILGKVVTTTNSQITLIDNKDKNRIIDIDEITKFSNENSKSYGISDVKKGDMLGIIGLYNKDTERLLARFVDRISALPTHFEGVITGIDKINFQLFATDENGNKRIIDIVPSTKNFTYSKDQGQIKSGFSKFSLGERIFASGFPDSKIKNQLNTVRIVSFPQLPPSEKMKAYVPTSEVSPTP